MPIRFRYASLSLFFPLFALAGVSPARAATPHVLKTEPANGDEDVDPNLRQIVIYFDQMMKGVVGEICAEGPDADNAWSRGRSWRTASTMVLNVQLKPDHIYDLTISCPDSRPFSSRSGESLEPVKLRFVTRSLTPADQQRTMNVAAFDEAKRVMEEYYVHYDRKGVDWNARFEEMRSRVVDAPGSALWTERMVELLSVADDPLIWLTYDGAYTRTCRRGIEPNFNYKTAEKTIGKLTRRSQYVYSARTEDGIGYVLIYSWEGATDETTSLFDQVLALMEDTRALIIDVRPNEGGIPETAISVAGWFVQDETVVLKTIFRDARRPSGMTPPFERKVSPRDASKRYENRVAILMGAKTMASSEWFVLAAKAGRRVRTFGAKTRGASGGGYCSQLPNAVQFCVARSRDVLPDGSSMDGITPDIPVEAKDEDFKTSDPVLEAALAALRKRIK